MLIIILKYNILAGINLIIFMLILACINIINIFIIIIRGANIIRLVHLFYFKPIFY